MLRVVLAVLMIDVSISILVKNDEIPSVSYFTEKGYEDKIEPVRNFLKYYNSLRPIGVLVDDTEESCEDAGVFVGKMFEMATWTIQLKFFIYKFNESGIMPLAEAYGNESERINSILSYKKEREQSFLGTQRSNGTLAFFAILNAAAKLPKNSAILMFIERKIQDEDLSNHLGILAAKDIRVYVVWGGKFATRTKQERLLREVCNYSDGLFLFNIWKSRNTSNYKRYLENHNTYINTSVVVTKSNLEERTEFEFSVEGEVMGIHLKISPPQTQGMLTTPSGYKIDLRKDEAIANYGEISFGKASATLREIYLDASSAPKVDVLGQWRATFEGAGTPYNVTVFMDTPLTANGIFDIKNNNNKGNKLSRMTYVDKTQSVPNTRKSFLIDVGEESELRADGGTKPIIIFEVTNMKNEPANVRFFCEDQKSLLLEMDPYSRLMSPRETVKVKLTLTAMYGTYQDQLTFTASSGNEYIKKKVLVDIGMTHENDNASPSLEYSFPSDCSGVILSQCQGGMWTIEVKAKDTGSGLLQITSYPKGIYFLEDFITGTKDTITGVYSDSCCSPDLQITAIDIANNRNTITVNAYRSSWNAAQISALILGILLLFLIIGIIIFLLVRWRRKKQTFELPTYHGGDI